MSELNDLSRKCLDPEGKQLVFAVKRGTDSTILWKATTRIACVKVDPVTRKIDTYKLINLKQFIQVFHTMTTNLEAITTYEEKQRSNNNSPSANFNSNRNKGLLGESFLNEIENQFDFNDEVRVEQTLNLKYKFEICEHLIYRLVQIPWQTNAAYV